MNDPETPPSTRDGGEATGYPAGHGYTPHTGPFRRHDGTDPCRVMLARYGCPYTREQHDPALPPVDVNVFGYRRGRIATPDAPARKVR